MPPGAPLTPTYLVEARLASRAFACPEILMSLIDAMPLRTRCALTSRPDRHFVLHPAKASKAPVPSEPSGGPRHG